MPWKGGISFKWNQFAKGKAMPGPHFTACCIRFLIECGARGEASYTWDTEPVNAKVFISIGRAKGALHPEAGDTIFRAMRLLAIATPDGKNEW
jgi:hypothetical protein